MSKIWVCRKPALRQLASLGVSKTLNPAPAQGSTGDWRVCLVAPSWLGSCRQVPRRRLASAAARLGWLAGAHHPTAAAAGRTAAARRGHRHERRGTPGRSRRRAFRLARGITPGHPTARSPATPGPPPQSTSQPGAAGPVASRLTIYSPPPFGWGNARQALKCTKTFPGALLNYVSGPCTGFFPYKVGHLFGPETPFKGLGGNSADFT